MRIYSKDFRNNYNFLKLRIKLRVETIRGNRIVGKYRKYLILYDSRSGRHWDLKNQNVRMVFDLGDTGIRSSL